MPRHSSHFPFFSLFRFFFSALVNFGVFFVSFRLSLLAMIFHSSFIYLFPFFLVLSIRALEFL